jgi:tripartite-type tricarboxylate transporter receptor subunit TctC
MHGPRAAFAVVLAAVATVAAAQDFPSKPLRWIVPFPPGGPTDSFSRPVAQKLGEILGQPVLVENVPGAGAVIGMDRVAKIPYNALADFSPLTLAVSYVNVLVTNPNVPANTVAELVAFARANPGKVNFGSAGNGSSNHLSGELLKSITGAPMQHVPYRGSAPALTDVMAGNLTFMFDILVTSAPQARAGKVKALAVTSAKRSAFMPEVPTMAESGVAGYAEAGSDLWFGIVGPAKIPPAIVARLNQALIESIRDPDMRGRIRGQMFDPLTSTPQEFAQTIKSDYDKWGRIVKSSGARVD